MHSKISLLLFTLLTLFTSLSVATPIKRGFCIDSPNPIYKISNFAFHKNIISSPDVSPTSSVTFAFSDIYHGFSTTCHANIDNTGASKTFDGAKSYECDDGDATQFRFWENGTLEMMHRWTCDSPGGAPTQHFAASSSGQVPWGCTKSDLEHGGVDVSCKQGSTDWYPEPKMVKLV